MPLSKTEFKLLIIEDNLGDLLLIKEYLKKNISNPTIYHASTFAKAVEFLGENIELDLILLDLTLPDAEGEQLVLDILNFAGYTPVIVLTGYLDQDFAIKTLSLGISDYLLKDEINASDLNKSIVYSIERKRSERVLKESNERYEILAQATSDTIWDWDIELDKIQYNDSFTRMFGYEESVAENTSKWWAIKVHPHDILKVNSQLNYSFKNHITNLQLEYRFLCSDNSYKYISDRAFIVFDKAGKPKRLIGAMQDISEKMKAEIERVELLKVLQNKNRDLQQFSYIVSHNLRSHIAKIMGLAFLLKIEPDHKINNLSLPECLEQEVTNLGNVVNDMNTIISFRDANHKQKDNISFNTELKLVEQVLENQIAESNATITSNFQLKYIVTVKSYIYSIIFNLISNAIKYKQPNAPLAIHIETKQTENSICLSVSDNGLGIDLEKDGEELFGLYKRFHSSDIEGRGMGLSLVKTQTEALDGNIEVESIVNKGTTFKICLPINENQYAIDK